MGDLFKAGWSKGLSEGSPTEGVDAFGLSTFQNEFRVGYVLGYGESAFPGVPPDFRYYMIGELAANSGVPLSHFGQYGNLTSEELKQFTDGYNGDQGQASTSDSNDDDLDD